jgi:hypothetical protein
MNDTKQQREEIRSLLAGGLKTEMSPRADTPDERESIVRRLQAEAHDLKAKLVIADFALKPVEHGGFTQHCETCMYFKIHQKHCELPELDLTVDPEWSCRLWRI